MSRRRALSAKQLKEKGMELISTITLSSDYNLLPTSVLNYFFPSYSDTNSSWYIVCRGNSSQSNMALKYMCGNWVTDSHHSAGYTAAAVTSTGTYALTQQVDISNGTILELWAMNTDSICNRYSVG